jgi:hypothetical protein
MSDDVKEDMNFIISNLEDLKVKLHGSRPVVSPLRV